MPADDPQPSRVWKLPDIVIAGRTLELKITGWPLVVLLLSVGALIWAIIYNVRVDPEGLAGAFTTGCTILLPILISLLLAPREKSEDHSTQAVMAVRDLQELRRSQESILEDLHGIDLTEIDAVDGSKIVRSREELLREYRQVGRSIGYWMDISPTVATDVMEKYSKQSELLAEMEEWYRSEDQ